MVIVQFIHTTLLGIVVVRTFSQLYSCGSSLSGPERSMKACFEIQVEKLRHTLVKARIR